MNDRTSIALQSSSTASSREGGMRTAAIVAGAAAVAIIAVHWPTAYVIARMWAESDAYAYGLFVLPVFAWLVWRNRGQLLASESRPFWPALMAVALAGFVWLMGEVTSVKAVSQPALVVMLQMTVVAVLGVAASWTIAFPLAFLFFAVPTGDLLTPLLLDGTADATVALLKLSGVPVYREGNQFVVPTGRWSVVDACSGLRYLISALFAGCVYAYVQYRSIGKRLLFIAACIIAPILGNWLRAYGLVMIAYLSNNKIGMGFEHFVLGWVWFGVVILALFWAGSFWADPEPAQTVDPRAEGRPPVSVGTLSGVAIGAVLLAGIWRPAAALIDASVYTQAPTLSRVAAVNGWSDAAAPVTTWTPRFVGSKAQLQQAFEKQGGKVGLDIEYYRGQGAGSQLVTYENRLAPAEGAWIVLDSRHRQVRWIGRPVTARATVLRGPEGDLAVVAWYWIADRYTSNDYVAKALMLFSKLVNRRDDSVAIMLYAPISREPEAAFVVLDRFAQEMGEPTMSSIDAAHAQ
jgi:exosortase A